MNSLGSEMVLHFSGQKHLDLVDCAPPEIVIQCSGLLCSFNGFYINNSISQQSCKTPFVDAKTLVVCHLSYDMKVGCIKGTHFPLCTWSLSSPSSQYSFTHIPRIWKLVNSQGNQALTYCCISICYIFLYWEVLLDIWDIAAVQSYFPKGEMESHMAEHVAPRRTVKSKALGVGRLGIRTLRGTEKGAYKLPGRLWRHLWVNAEEYCGYTGLG